MHALAGLRDVASLYDALLVDLHGVIHDGTQPFAGAVDALQNLRSAGRRVIFVTNSSRTGAVVEETLASMGIGKELYETVISSGDVTRAALIARDPAVFAPLPAGPRCVHVGNAAFVPWLFELGLTFTDDVAHADLVLATGIARSDEALALLREELAPAAARNVPLVCTNPDRVIPTASGLTLGPGAIAAAYAELGAPVFLYGKPHAAIYAAARVQLGADTRLRVLAIGDLLDTDVRGAREAGIPSVLVTGTGGHAQDLGDTPEAAALETLFLARGVAPDMTIARFAW